MKLDVSFLRFMSREEFRVLTAVEMGMKNHDLVPVELIESIAGLKHGGTNKIIRLLLKKKLVSHDSQNYDGYRLNYSGYDALAMKALVQKGAISAVGKQIGVGKEADIFSALTDDGEEVVVKIHRLGRISFRAVKSKRDYLRHRKSASWLYLSRLAAMKEYAYMKALSDRGFPVPKAYEWNRHVIVMSLVDAYPMTQVAEITHVGAVYSNLMELIVRLGQAGLIHSDFNEFNLLIDNEERVTLIDFPQMVSTSHRNAQMYFDRDVQCIRTYFARRYNYTAEAWPVFADVLEGPQTRMDQDVQASGFDVKQQNEMEQLLDAQIGSDEFADASSVAPDTEAETDADRGGVAEGGLGNRESGVGASAGKQEYAGRERVSSDESPLSDDEVSPSAVEHSRSRHSRRQHGRQEGLLTETQKQIIRKQTKAKMSRRGKGRRK